MPVVIACFTYKAVWDTIPKRKLQTLDEIQPLSGQQDQDQWLFLFQRFFRQRQTCAQTRWRRSMDAGLCCRLVLDRSLGGTRPRRGRNQFSDDAFGTTADPAQQADAKPSATFNIGSIDALERHLESAQHQLGIDPMHCVPVHYTSEMNWTVELFRMLPSLLIIGMIMLSMRKLAAPV